MPPDTEKGAPGQEGASPANSTTATTVTPGAVAHNALSDEYVARVLDRSDELEMWQRRLDNNWRAGWRACAAHLGIAPGSYMLRRQREQADEERLIAD